MKKLLLIITFAIAALCANAQSNSEHLKFKGVPIDGTVTEFAKKLEEKGFKTLMAQGDTYCITGDFAGYSNCMVYLMFTKSTKEVYGVGVIPSFCKTWNELISQYNKFKNNLTIKYGEPTGCIEEFKSYTPHSDQSKFYAVERGDCDYKTLFETESGSITVGISSTKNDGEALCSIAVVYTDKANKEKEDQNVIDDL